MDTAFDTLRPDGLTRSAILTYDYTTASTDMAAAIVIDQASDARFDALTQIPHDIGPVVPGSTVSILSLLEYDLPEMLTTSADSLPDVSSCIMYDECCWSNAQLTSPVPPRAWVGNLELELKQCLNSGQNPLSLRHPTIDSLLLPLWGVGLWSNLVHAIEQRDKWERSDEWLDERVKEGVEVDEVRALMGRVSWRMRVRAIHEASPIGLLSDLLSTRWIRERHLDIFARYLTSRAAVSGARIWFGGAVTAAELTWAPEDPKKPVESPVGLRRILVAVSKGGFDRLLLPGHVDGNHWITLSVDLWNRRVSVGTSFSFAVGECIPIISSHYLGDSQGGVPRAESIEALSRKLIKWLNDVFGPRFTLRTEPLPTGRQQDGYSCGVCVMNAMEHAAFNITLFTPKDRHRLRIRYFIHFVRFLYDDVCLSPCENVSAASDLLQPPPAEDIIDPTAQQLLPQLPPASNHPTNRRRRRTKPTGTSEAFAIESSAVQGVMPHAGNQAFQSLGFNMERSIANARWATKRSSEPYPVPGTATDFY